VNSSPAVHWCRRWHMQLASALST